MVSFDEIKKANETIRTTNIKGKDYAEVNQRIKAFRMVYPTGTIQTEIIEMINGTVTMKATVGDSGIVLATGLAQEKEDSSFINKTSYIENCETSAVGRALGMAGFGIDTSVASYEEVANAIEQQNAENVISKAQAEALIQSIKNNMLDVNGTSDEVLKKFGYEKVEDIKIKDFATVVMELKKYIKE